MIQQIKNCDNKKIIHEFEGSLKEAVEDAIKNKISLAFADLTYANLASADLTGANLASAYLTGADLRGANLEGANINHYASIKDITENIHEDEEKPVIDKKTKVYMIVLEALGDIIDVLKK